MKTIDVVVFAQAIQTHLGILQNIIQRMASNSGACKSYCVTLVSAILVIVADKGKPNYAFIALVPILLFLLLDTYYLGMERAFRERYKDFVVKYHDNILQLEDMYEMTPFGGVGAHVVAALPSVSILPFYLTLAGMVYLAWGVVIPVK